MDEANYYKQIFNSGKIGVLDWDLSHDTILVSETLCNILGLQSSKSGMKKFSVSELIPQSDLTSIHETIEILKSQHLSDFSLQHRMIQDDGNSCWVLQNGTISYDKKWNPISLVSSIINITKMKISELAIKDSEARYRALFESSNEGLLLLDKDHNTILYANETIAQMVDYSISDLIKMKFKDIAYEGIDKKLENILQFKNSILSDIPLRRSNNEYIYVDINCILTTIDDTEYYICLIRDITERKEYEYSILESKKKYHAYIANAPYGVFIVDSEGNYIEVNLSACEITGYSETELLTMNIKDIINPKYLNESIEDFCNLLKHDKMNVVSNCITKDGNPFKLSINAVKINENRFIGFCQDVTEHKQAENLQHVLFKITESFSQTSNLDELLEIIHKALGTLIDTTNFYIALYDTEKNQYTFPYSVDQYDDIDFTPQQLHKSLTDYVRRLGKPIIVNEETHNKLIKNGEVKLVGHQSPIWLGVPLKTLKGVIGVVVVQSYTDPNAFTERDLDIISFASEQIARAIERKRTEKILKESEEQFKRIAEQSFDAVVMINLEGIIQYTSPAITIILGYDTQELLGKNILEYVPPEEFEKTKATFMTISQGNLVNNLMSKFRKKDGTILDIEVNVAPIYEKSKIIGACGFLKDVTERNRILQKLKDSEDKYRELFNESIAAIYLFDRQRNFIDSNQAGLNLLGYTRDELLKMGIPDIDADPKEVVDAHQSLAEGDNLINFEHRLKRKDGTIITVLNNSKSLTDSKGNIVGIQSTLFDITDRKKTEKALKESENKFKAFTNQSTEGIGVTDLEGNYVFVNPAYCKMSGYTQEELLTMSIFKIRAKEHILENSKNKRTTTKGESIQINLQRKDKSYFLAEIIDDEIKIGDEKFILGTVRDISERKAIENKLNEEQERAQMYLDMANVMFVVMDTTGTVTLVNQKTCEVLGYSEKNIVGKNWFDNFLPHRIREKTKHVAKKLLRGDMESVKYYENVVLTKNGSERMIAWHNITLRNSKGTIIGHLSSGEDITERKQAEENLKESEKKYRNLFEVAQEGIWVLDADSYTTLVNSSMAAMLGYSIDEMMGKHLFYFMDEQGIELSKKNIKRRKAGIKEQHDFEFITKNGTRIITTLETAPIFDDDKKYIGAIAGVINITSRKAAETALAESQKQFDQILDRSKAVVYVKDLNHKYLYANMEFKNLFNISMENLMGKTDYDLFPKEVADKFIKNDNRSLTEKYYYRVNEEVLHEDGLHTYISDKFPLYDSNGDIYATCGVSTDITELLEAQQKEKYVQQQLVKKDRLINVGHLAAAIAHEINNPMTVLHGSLEEIKESKESINEEIIDSMLRVSHRIKKIISNLLIFTRQEDNHKQATDINSVIQTTFLLISNLLHKSSIEFILDLSKDKLNLDGDPARIQQVFINIIFNAMHAMPGGGLLKVKSYIQDNNICISFEDNGTGIEEENLKSIFLPFFTTKEVGEGTGLGLSISHGIIEEHGGSFSVTSEVNKGSTFTVIFPLP